MKNCANASWAPDFSHLYIENKVRREPLTIQLLQRFPEATVVWIDNYRHVFTRPRQAHHLQRQSRKLIVAHKPDDFLYAGADPCQDFGQPDFFYTTPALNCIYDCEYCFLQGLYPSANLVVFANTDDFFQAVQDAVGDRAVAKGPLPLHLSYETDLLALERYFGLIRRWLAFAAGTPELQLEIRTKSAAYPVIADIPPNPQTILAWTLSPNPVIAAVEHGSPPLRARLRAARQALQDGWQLRLCFDPILPVDNWETVYAEFIEQVFRELPGEQLYDASLGVFRMGEGLFKRIRKQRRDAAIYYDPHLEHESAMVSFQPDLRNKLLTVVKQKLEHHLPADRLFVETADLPQQ